MLTSDFDYNLPDRLIAHNPLEPRDSCGLMVLDRRNNNISDDLFFHIGRYLRSGDTLVLNDTRVIPCRLVFKYRDRNVEIFVTDFPGDKVVTALVRPGRLFKKGCKLDFDNNISAFVEDVMSDGQRLISFDGDLSARELVEAFGRAPFPPYIKESKADFEQYQTVYAKNTGSLAAPTAGLHFTDTLLHKLRSSGIGVEYVTLHVGLGTFLPVKEKELTRHKMHEERYSIDAGTAKRLNGVKDSGGRIIAVGTTAVRVLESSYGINGFEPGRGSTDIFIYPGYEWKCVDGLLTNFHLPKSTLLMLVSSFAGKEFIMRAYESAIRKRYRFFSFGDAMLIL